MKKYLSYFTILLTLISCDRSTQIIDKKIKNQLIPTPKEIATSAQSLLLSDQSKLFSESKELLPLLDLFQEELKRIYQIDIPIESKLSFNSDIIFKLDEKLDKKQYQIEITNKVQVKGGSYKALAMAKNSLLQLADKRNDQIVFPILSINDFPDSPYRGLMIDLARQWHSIEIIKKTIDLAAFYKSNYLHLHFSDYQSYTLPCTSYPNLSTEGKTYTKEELQDLENYSQKRGITIIPEIDVPGHSSPFVNKYPEIFAIDAVDENPWIINMGREEAYVALEDIIAEICEIFPSTPYFHIGGDEAIFHKVMEDEDVKNYIKSHEIEEDVHELYRHFLIRMNKIVKKQNKQMCVWEGFGREGHLEIPKDIIVFEFETNRYLPQHLVEDGYTVVNTSWRPLYVVNQKKWSPKTIYNWNIWRWENWYDQAPSYDPIQLEETDLIIGAQMCAWEQADVSEIPSIRKRLPTMNERIWNTHQTQSYEEFRPKLNINDSILSLLIQDERQDKLLDGYEFSKELLE